MHQSARACTHPAEAAQLLQDLKVLDAKASIADLRQHRRFLLLGLPCAAAHVSLMPHASTFSEIQSQQ